MEHQLLPKADSYISLNLIPVTNPTEKHSMTIDNKVKPLANDEKKRMLKKCVTSSPGLRRANKAHVIA